MAGSSKAEAAGIREKHWEWQGQAWALTIAWYLLAWPWGAGSRGAHCSSRISALDRNSLSFCTLQRKHRDTPHPCRGRGREEEGGGNLRKLL